MEQSRRYDEIIMAMMAIIYDVIIQSYIMLSPFRKEKAGNGKL